MSAFQSLNFPVDTSLDLSLNYQHGNMVSCLRKCCILDYCHDDDDDDDDDDGCIIEWMNV